MIANETVIHQMPSNEQLNFYMSIHGMMGKIHTIKQATKDTKRCESIHKRQISTQSIEKNFKRITVNI